MAKKKNDKSSAPKSLSITRKKNKYTFSWTLGEKYSKQQFEYKVDHIGKKKDKWVPRKISKSAKKESIEINGKNIDKIMFHVKGTGVDTSKVNKTESKLADYTMQISPPNKPKIQVRMTADNAATFAFESKDEEKKPIYYLKWQSILSKNGTEPSLKENWSKYTSKNNYASYHSGDTKTDKGKIQYKASGSWSHTESFTTGWVRHFKVQAVGAGGESAWVSAKQVYNSPDAAKNIKCSSISEKNGRITMKVTWDSDTSKAHPIKQSSVQYYIGKLGQNLEPSQGSWQDAPGGSVKDFPDNKKGTQTASIRIDSPVETDQCLWIRVVNYYTSLPVESDPVLVKKLIKPLATPTINTIDYDSITYRVSISATNNSEAYGSKLVVYYYDSDDTPASGKIIGIINGSQASTFQCPNWTGHTPISFGVQAIIGDIKETVKDNDTYFRGYILSSDTSMILGKQYYWYITVDSYDALPIPVDIAAEYPSNPQSQGWLEDIGNVTVSTDTSVVAGKTYYSRSRNWQAMYYEVNYPSGNPSARDYATSKPYYEVDNTTPNGATYYTFDSVAESLVMRDGGNTPVSPAKPNVVQVGLNGTVQITWDVPWEKATGAEIVWADHDDALYSTNGPSTYEVTNIKQSKLNIADLELGKAWYFWVRLYSVNDSGNNIYSEYSPMAILSLSSAPAIPNFEISPAVVPNTSESTFTCSWDFESSDGTDQASASIYEVIDVEGQEEPDYILFDSNISTQRTKSYAVRDLVGSRNGWTVGSTHSLSIRVMSEGGMTSELSARMPISIADPIDLKISNTSLISALNLRTYTGTTISENIDSYKDIYQATVDIPYTGNRYNAISMAQTADSTTETVSCIFGTGDSYPDVGYFYGGTYNFITGVLTGEYSIDGTPYEEPKISQIDTLPLTIRPGTTNTFVTSALMFQSVVSPIIDDLSEYYELDTLTSGSVNKLSFYKEQEEYKVSDESVNIAAFTEDFRYVASGTNVTATALTLRISPIPRRFQQDLFDTSISPVATNCSIAYFVESSIDISIPIPDLVVGTDNSYTASVEVTTQNSNVSNITFSLGYTGDILQATINMENDSEETRTYNIAIQDGEYNWITTYYAKTTDTELSPGKTYYELVDSGASVDQIIAVCDNTSTHAVLRNLPLQIWIDNLSESETVNVNIYRESNFVPPTPDENEFIGYAGETAFIGNYSAEDLASGPISIDIYEGQESGQYLSQKLDDEGNYILQISASDSYGQTTEPVTMPFVVNWENQAVEPDGDATIANNVAYIRAIKPQLGPNDPPHDFTGDTIDIYRLSGDKPVLIYRGAAFYDDTSEDTIKATTYVDPYPTIGPRGGYRLVLITRNGDYIANTVNDDNEVVPTPAWIDLEGHVESKFHFIDFGDQHLDFIYNVDYDNSWNKSFTLTHYLGGSIQGDWIAGVERSGNIKGMTFDDIEPETYDAFRDLAEYIGLCHIRTLDGSNYTGNVAVSDSSGFNKLAHQHDISLSVQRCDNPSLDGMTEAQWEELNS